jgi:hypothetical protein
MYGDLYYPRLIRSPTIVESVLERRSVTQRIDENGFRNPPFDEPVHILALGDSYTFGVNTDGNKIWVARLQEALGQPVYNLGVSAHSPQEELMLLDYFLRQEAAPDSIQHVLWMIFEGNDLEDPYSSSSSPPVERGGRRGVASLGRAVLELLTEVPSKVKRNTLINGLRKGRFSLSLPSAMGGPENTASEVDGVRLGNPLYHSDRHGFKLFYPEYIEAASRPEAYVRTHPNRPFLDELFADMDFLSEEFGFEVTVVIAPSAPTLYAPYFRDFPAISEAPYFINYVRRLSEDLGFDVIDLYPLMEPYAREELLFWRDDSHWNERGHEVAAALIAEKFEGRQLRRAPATELEPQ